MNKKPLLGPDGNPIRETDVSGNLSVEIQALVETRVNAALNEAKENLQKEIAEAKKELKADAAHARKISLARFVVFLLLNIALVIIPWIYGPPAVKEWTRAFVDDHMNKPTLDEAAREVVTNRMSRFVLEKLAPLSVEIDHLNSSVIKAQDEAEKLRNEQKLIALLNRGESFDVEAVHELQRIGSNTNEISTLAKALLAKVQRDLVLDRSANNHITLTESAGNGDSFSGPFSTDELAEWLTTETSPQVDGAINIIADGKNNFFVPKLVELAHTSKDLWTVNRISSALGRLTGVSFYPWELQPLDKWWEQNHSNYTNWPFEIYATAFEATQACRYQEALTNYESVLKMDPSADKSRALAVACAIATGNLSKAQQLNRDFVLRAGRWDEWAQAKMALATNGVENGTRAFVSLSKKYPTFASVGFINPRNDILKQIDWTLYSELMRLPTNLVTTNVFNQK